MRLYRLLPVAVLVVAPLLAHPASAGPCNTTNNLPYNGSVVVCENQPGCLIYENSSSDIHRQVPICISR
jgi:hypothetical protein